MPPDNALVPTTPKPEAKRRRISQKMKAAIEDFARGGRSQKECAAKNGLSESHFCRALQLPHAAEYLQTRARQIVASGAPRAAHRMLQLLDADSSLASYHASKFVLGANGVSAGESSTNVNINVGLEVRAGYVIDVSEPAPKVIDHQEQNRDAN